MSIHDRRHFLGLLAFAIGILKGSASAAGLENLMQSVFPKAGPSNFVAVYRNPALRQEFYHFLENVYHIYPEKDFHTLIEKSASRWNSDAEIYAQIQQHLGEVKPFLSEVRYGLPALNRQRQVMTEQTLQLLNGVRTVDGYLEIGTMGRYTRNLQEKIELRGPVLLMNASEPGYSPVDIVERGGISQVGTHVPLADYSPLPLPKDSLGLITNYIGLHHAPLPKLDAFVASISQSLRKGGLFLLRDHQVNSGAMYSIVALAHDVFNAGLGVPWSENAAELRHFKSLESIDQHLLSHGLQRRGTKLLQDGDPTHNSLMIYEKIA